MGWWKIRDVESGGIDWDHKGPGQLVNAIPGETPENYYNGDRPADYLGGALKDIEEFAEKNKIKLTRKILERAFFKGQGVAYIIRRFQNCTETIINEYKRVWKRPPYPEELKAVFNFCVNPDYED